MQKPQSLFAVTLTIVLACVAMDSVSAATWVRGLGRINPGGTVDPLINVGPGTETVATGTFSDAQKGFTSTADLGNGELRGRVYMNGGLGSAVANPVIGETIEFDVGGDEDTWTFEFFLEGVINTTGNLVEMASGFQRYTTSINVHIFPGGTVGPSSGPDSWVDAFVNEDYIFTDKADITPAVLDDISDLPVSGSVFGSIPLVQGTNVFDVVLVLALAGNISGGDYTTGTPSFDFNFLSTASFSLDTDDPENTFVIPESDVFLSGLNNGELVEVLDPVPIPAAFPLFATALGGLALTGWRRKRNA